MGDKNQDAVRLGRLGGRKGGPARAAALSPEQRSAIARKAARVRWGYPAEDTAPASEQITRVQQVLDDIHRTARGFRRGFRLKLPFLRGNKVETPATEGGDG